MNKGKRIILNILKRPYMLAVYAAKRFPRLFNDRTYIALMYRAAFGKKPNLDRPKTYNEKLQWLKLNAADPSHAALVDKYLVKEFVREKAGDQCLIPTLGVWERFDDIDFAQMPSAFVLKCTHDSGSVVICKDKTTFDLQAARKKLSAALAVNYFYKSREYPYKTVQPRIIAEPYMEDLGSGQLYDYKIFCFNGEPKYMFIASDRASEVKFDYFDVEFNRLPMRQVAHPNSTLEHKKPACFEEMLQTAKKLAEGLIQVRVDFYVVNDKMYFGELTFFHHGGFVPFVPEKYDDIWGDALRLPIVGDENIQ